MNPWLQDPDVTLYHGDVLAVLRELPAESVDCCVTSPPYWGLRDYGTGAWEGGHEGCDHKPERGKYAQGCVECGCPMSQFSEGCAHCADRKTKRELRGTPEKDYAPYDPQRSDLPNPPAGWAERDSTVTALQTCHRCGATRIDQQLGLEPTPEEYVTRMVEVFREVRRVLAPHGTVWLNLGDSYASQGGPLTYDFNSIMGGKPEVQDYQVNRRAPPGLKPKDLVGIPWRVAFALQADGWYLRSDIIWSKPNPMPESVTDRPTKAHEYVFLLSKQPRYFFDQEAVREAAQWERWGDQTVPKYNGTETATGWMQPKSKEELRQQAVGRGRVQPGNTADLGDAQLAPKGMGRNIRSVWEIATQPYPEAHFATFPEELARRCIAAGCPEQVCRVCGKARERIVETTYTNGGAGGAQGGIGDARRDPGSRSDLPTQRKTRHDETLGFTECPCVPPMRDTRTAALQKMSDAELAAEVENFTLDGPGTKYRPGVTLDPFIGSGTVAYVARKLGRHAIGIDLNESYLELAARRLQQQSLFAEAAS